ncbi:MAG: HD domain-containing protein [Solirubrobacterales bacterium]|nr:HD domain-containing protein [Solirubrobacterales bacterium]
MFVRELQSGQSVDQILLVREIEVRRKKDGDEFLKMVLADRTGAVAGVMWDGTSELAELFVAGTVARVTGRYAVKEPYGPQLTIAEIEIADPSQYALEDLLDGPTRALDEMVAGLRELIASVQDPSLADLLNRILGEESDIWPQFRDAPAAKFNHHAYRHGLLDHSLQVADCVAAISATFPGINRDLALTGALLHDIGKLEAYTQDPQNIDLTDAGRLQGEIPLGYYRIRREIEEINGFGPETAQALLHIILSHHGQLEHGSPVLPSTREATLVHMIDNLGGRLGSFDRLEKELAEGAQWSRFDRTIGGGAFFGDRQVA